MKYFVILIIYNNNTSINFHFSDFFYYLYLIHQKEESLPKRAILHKAMREDCDILIILHKARNYANSF